jgi:DNA polymerase III alpha subunit
MLKENSQEKFAIRFGLGAVKAVGFKAMENAVKEREMEGKFLDIYNFSSRLDPRLINKKSIEALSKCGAFDSLQKNRRQIAESFDLLSSYAAQKSEEANSNQMSLFGGLCEVNSKPELKKIADWNKIERLQKEFEAFGFFLNEHPLDDSLNDLKKRGVIFSNKLEREELEDGNLVKMAGVIAASKHRSGPRGRFAYMTISDPFGIFEATIFDESIITSARDILVDGSAVFFECLIRKDEGGSRILVREVRKLEEFIKNTQAQDVDFEDIKKQPSRENYNRNNYKNSSRFGGSNEELKLGSFQKKKTELQVSQEKVLSKKNFSRIEISVKTPDSILAIKSLLFQHFAPIDATNFTTVFFVVFSKKKLTKIQLAQKYFLGEDEVFKLKKLEKIISVELTL